MPATALLPKRPARRASPERMRARSSSTFESVAASSRPMPPTRFPPIQNASKPAPRKPTTTLAMPNAIPTRPSAISSEAELMRAAPYRQRTDSTADLVSTRKLPIITAKYARSLVSTRPFTSSVKCGSVAR